MWAVGVKMSYMAAEREIAWPTGRMPRGFIRIHDSKYGRHSSSYDRISFVIPCPFLVFSWRKFNLFRPSLARKGHVLCHVTTGFGPPDDVSWDSPTWTGYVISTPLPSLCFLLRLGLPYILLRVPLIEIF